MPRFEPTRNVKASAHFEKSKVAHVYFQSDEEVVAVVAGAAKTGNSLSGFCRQAVLFAISQMEDARD